MRRSLYALGMALALLVGACSFGDDGPTTAERPEATPEVLSNTVTADTNNSGIPTPTAVVTEIVGDDPGNVYVVQPGDLLGLIAQRLEVDVDELADLNGITDPNLLQVGDKLLIPGAEDDDTTDDG